MNVQQHSGISGRACAWTAAACTAAFIALYSWSMHTRSGQRIDQAALEWTLHAIPPGSDLWQRLSLLNELPVIVATLGGVGVLACAWIRRQPLVTLVIPALAAGAAIGAAQLLKHVILTRPWLGVVDDALNQFPSGHTTLAAAAAVALMLAVPGRARALAIIVGALVSVIVAAGTWLMGWHRPSEVVAALLVVAVFGSLGAWVITAADRKRSRAAAEV